MTTHQRPAGQVHRGRYVERCSFCGRNFFMVQNEKTGNWQPVDIVGVYDGPGNIVMTGAVTIKCRVLTKEDLESGLHWYRHMPHQATCGKPDPSAAAPARALPPNVVVFPSRPIP